MGMQMKSDGFFVLLVYLCMSQPVSPSDALLRTRHLVSSVRMCSQSSAPAEEPVARDEFWWRISTRDCVPATSLPLRAGLSLSLSLPLSLPFSLSLFALPSSLFPSPSHPLSLPSSLALFSLPPSPLARARAHHPLPLRDPAFSRAASKAHNMTLCFPVVLYLSALQSVHCGAAADLYFPDKTSADAPLLARHRTRLTQQGLRRQLRSLQHAESVTLSGSCQHRDETRQVVKWGDDQFIGTRHRTRRAAGSCGRPCPR